MRIKIVLIFTQLFFAIYAVGQSPWCYEFSTSLNSSDSSSIKVYIDTSSNDWQIGVPHKKVFQSGYDDSSSIVTNLTNPYSENRKSVFIASLPTLKFPDYLGIHGVLRVEFYHRFVTDSLKDFGFIEISLDSGQNWTSLQSTNINSSNDPGSYQLDDSNNYHIFEKTGLYITDSLNISGNSDGWVHSRFTKGIDRIYNNAFAKNWMYDLLIRFSFFSDSTMNSFDGWQIDNLDIKVSFPRVSIEDENIERFRIYPNPAFERVLIHAPNENQYFDYNLFDCQGKIVKCGKNINQSVYPVNLVGLRKGIYIIQIVVKDKFLYEKLVIN